MRSRKSYFHMNDYRSKDGTHSCNYKCRSPLDLYNLDHSQTSGPHIRLYLENEADSDKKTYNGQKQTKRSSISKQLSYKIDFESIWILSMSGLLGGGG